MPYSNKQMLRDANGDLIPQYWDVVEQDFKPLTGQGGANDVRLTEETEKKLDNIYKSINIISKQKTDNRIFGVYWDKTPNPTMTRIDDAEGLEANVGVDGEYVKNDFDNLPIWGEMGEVTDEYGNTFIRIPKFYIQKKEGKNHKILRISKTAYPGFYLPYVFWDFEEGKELDYFDYGKYEASLGEDGRLESKSGTHPLVNQNIVSFRNYERNNSDDSAGLKGYQINDIHAIDVLQTLFTIEFATLDSQSVMMGHVSGRYTETDIVTVAESDANRVIVSNASADQFIIGQSIGIGTTRGGQQVASNLKIINITEYDSNNKALEVEGGPITTTVGNYVYTTGWTSGFSADIASSSGSIEDNTSGKYPCVYRGIENPWGNIYEWIDGININNNQSWICKNANDYASNVFASPYEKLGYVNSASNGYVRDLGFDNRYPFAQLPILTGGGTSTYYADNYYQITGQRVARFGGSWASGANAGIWLWSLSDLSSASHFNVGARLLKKPL